MVRISCLVFAKQMTLEASVIQGSTPLPISKPSMAKLGIVLETARNRVRAEALHATDEKRRDVPVARSGHLLVLIDDLFLERYGKVDEAMVVSGMKPPAWRSNRAIMAAVTNLQKQIRHAAICNAVSLVKASQVDVTHKILDEFASDCECDACIQFEDRKPSAIVKMPRDPMFNKEISADVFYYK